MGATRDRLPSRRRSETQKARVGGQVMYVTCGHYPDGRLGEVFLDVARRGSGTRALMETLAMFLSLGLQHGVPLALYVDAMKGVDFPPQGPVQGCPAVPEAESVLDFLARHLEAVYLAPRPEESDAAERPRDPPAERPQGVVSSPR